jgi:NAD-dependent deacetylase
VHFSGVFGKRLGDVSNLAVRITVLVGRRLVAVTQNVDDLHERAGGEQVIHLHGSLEAARCFACARPYSLPALASSALTQSTVEPPRCAHCNGRVRPGVVWFGEASPNAELGLAFARAQECDVLLSVGTSGNVYPAAGIPEIALRHGARVVHSNTEVVDVAGAVTLQGLAGEWMGELVDATFGGSG